MDALHFQFEPLLEFKNSGQALRRFPHPAFPLLKFWVLALKPGEIFLPFTHVGGKLGEVPFVGLGDFSTSWHRVRHCETFNAQRPTSNAEFRPRHSSDGLLVPP